MALPKQVQRQIEEVEELEKLMKAPVESAENDEEIVDEAEDGQTTETEEEVTAQAVEEPTEKTPTQKETSSTEDAWEHKYHRLQGKYDAEVPRLHSQLKELAAQLEELKYKQSQAKAVEAEPAVEKIEPLVTDADIEEYGEDLVNLARRIAKDTIREDLATLKAENKALKEKLDQTGSQVGEVGFEARLHRMVPDFAQINADPAWIEWLDTTDPLLRAPRRAIAQEAFNRGDAEAIAHFVSLFRGEAGVPEADEKISKRSEVARQVQPSKTTASNTPVSQKGRTYSRADIDSMFRKITEYSSKQQHEKAKKLEAEIDAAFKEGRVQV